MNEFVGIDYVMSYPGMVAITILFTQVLKNFLDKWISNHTKYLVLGISTLLCIGGAVYYGDFTSGVGVVKTILIWLINDAMIWMASMKTFETMKGSK